MERSILVTGLGGQGVITLGKIIAVSGKLSGYNVIGYEQKGEAQRGGVVSSLIRLFKGKEHHSLSTRIKDGQIDMVFSLDLFETARCANLYNERTIVISNKSAVIPPLARESDLYIIDPETLRKAILRKSRKVYIEDFSGLSHKCTGSAINTNNAMLGWAISKELFFCTQGIVLKAVDIILKERGVRIVEKIITEINNPG